MLLVCREGGPSRNTSAPPRSRCCAPGSKPRSKMRRRVLQNEPGRARPTLHVVMIASPRMAYAFEQAISNAGLRASSDAPSRSTTATPSTRFGYEFEITGDEAISGPAPSPRSGSSRSAFPGSSSRWKTKATATARRSRRPYEGSGVCPVEVTMIVSASGSATGSIASPVDGLVDGRLLFDRRRFAHLAFAGLAFAASSSPASSSPASSSMASASNSSTSTCAGAAAPGTYSW